MKLKIFFTTSFILIGINVAFSIDNRISDHWNGELYSQNALLQTGWADSFFFNNYKFRGNEKVLDVGSGDGKITSRIAANVQSVIGLDSSTTMIQKASRDFGRIENIQFIKDSALDSTFFKKHANEFDLATSFLVAHWIPDNSLLLKTYTKA